MTVYLRKIKIERDICHSDKLNKTCYFKKHGEACKAIGIDIISCKYKFIFIQVFPK